MSFRDQKTLKNRHGPARHVPQDCVLWPRCDVTKGIYSSQVSGSPTPGSWSAPFQTCGRSKASVVTGSQGPDDATPEDVPFYSVLFLFSCIHLASTSAGYTCVTPLLFQVSVVNRAKVDLPFVFQNTLTAPVTVAESTLPVRQRAQAAALPPSLLTTVSLEV